MAKLNISKKTISQSYNMLRIGKAKAVTYSSLDEHLSIVLFNYHSDILDYINSIVHEAEHIKQAMLEAYYVKDSGEPPAYTVGYLVEMMYKGFIRTYS